MRFKLLHALSASPGTLPDALSIASWIVLAWLATGCAGGDSSATTPHAEALRVAVERPEPADGYDVLHAYSGRLETARTATPGFELGGAIVEVLVDEGDSVEAGQPLARLDTARLQAGRREILAELARARSQRRLTAQTLQRVEEAVGYRGVSRQRLDEAKDAHARAVAATTLAEARLATLDVELEKSVLYAPFAGTVARRLEDEGTVVTAGRPLLVLEETGRLQARIGVAGAAAGSLVPGERRRLQGPTGPLAARVRAVLPVRDPVARTVDVVLDLEPAAAATARAGDLVTLQLHRFEAAAGYWLPLAALSENERGLWSVLIAAPGQAADGARRGTGDQAAGVDTAAPRPRRAAGRGDDGDPRTARRDTPGPGHYHIARRVIEVRHHTGDRVFVSGGLTPEDWLVTGGTHRVVVGQRVQPVPDDVRVATESHAGRPAAFRPAIRSPQATSP